MAESEEALQLKRRARRRLVGAIALVTFVVTILPLLLDKEPGPAGPPLDVQIPRQESSGLTSRIVPPVAQLPVVPVSPTTNNKGPEPVPAKTEPPAGSEAPSGKADLPAVKAGPSAAVAETSPPKAAPAVADKAAPVPAQAADTAEQERAQSALRGETWAVALDAFSDAKNVKQLRTRLTAAGVKSYTEPVTTSKGELTRVRAGPFSSKEAADKARAKLEAMGLKPGAVASR
jgi:DedD protein